MFRKPKPNMIESDEGFSVQLVELSTLVYAEDARKLTLTVEHLVGSPAIFVVYLAEHDNWDAPFDAVKISDEEWKKIGDNIREAYRSQGFEIEIYLPSPTEREIARRYRSQLGNKGTESEGN